MNVDLQVRLKDKLLTMTRKNSRSESIICWRWCQQIIMCRSFLIYLGCFAPLRGRKGLATCELTRRPGKLSVVQHIKMLECIHSQLVKAICAGSLAEFGHSARQQHIRTLPPTTDYVVWFATNNSRAASDNQKPTINKDPQEFKIRKHYLFTWVPAK
jgi:hypothetical protein